MSSIVVSGDTSGAVTLSAPAVAGTVTVTLPAASGTMASLASVTANGVAYVNSSGQPTSGSALVFDGTNLSTTGYITATNTSNTTVAAGGFDATTSSSLRVVNASTTAGTGAGIYFVGGGNSESYIGNLYESSGVGALSFQTRVSGTRAERMRLDSSGNLLVGTTSALGSGKVGFLQSASGQVLTMQNSNAVPYGIVCAYTGAAPNSTISQFLYCDDTGGLRMEVRSNGGIANYTANNVVLSDRREKTNFAPAGSYLDKICAIPVQTFNYIDQNMEEDGGLTLGVVAQDVQAVAPELVTEGNWGSKDKPKMRFEIYQTDLQYALMKCIQEQQALITTLTARITALESA